MRRLALRGADLVLMARHPRWAGVRAPHNASLVVECDGPIDPGRVATALDRFLNVCPWPAARLRRTFPWGKLHWVAGPGPTLPRLPVRHATVATDDGLRAEIARELNANIDPDHGPLLRVLLLDGAGAGAPSAVVLTWFHPLMDARGGENLLAQLTGLDEGGGRDVNGERAPALATEREPRSLVRRARLAGRSLTYMRTLAPVPPVSPATGRAATGRACFRRDVFDEPDGGEDGRRATREIAWRLALAGRAMTELWQRRDLPRVPFLVPISVDLRPKGDAGPIFGSRLAFHFARFEPADTADVPALARALRRQMVEALRDGHIEANAVAMEFLKYRPLSTMLRVLPWTASGELFSFNCADLGDWPPALTHCFGRPVLNAYHVPVVPPRPGIGLIFNCCGSRNNLVISWIEGVVDEAEVARIIEVVRDGLGWARSA